MRQRWTASGELGLNPKLSIIDHREGPEKRAGQSRVRASGNSLDIALKSALSAGLTIEKLCVVGSRIEIHVRKDEPADTEPDDSGLEDW